MSPPDRPDRERPDARRDGRPVRAADPVPSIWTTGSTEVFKTGSWRTALARHIHAPAPCHAACPVNGDIAEWIGLARDHDLRGAWNVLVRHNPFPAIAGRICHHPCEAACNRAAFDGPLAICGLERFVGDAAIAAGWAVDPVEVSRGERIAIVGGGPSGLSAAFHLRRRGYAVTLFESHAELGGVMRYGIPAYRLARDVLDAEIARVVALGIDVRCNEPVGSRDDFARLRDAFDAVYVAIGAGRPKRLPQLDYAEPWVLDGAQYLARFNAGAAPGFGPRVVVIGGGSAAFDVARSARRADHTVTILALEGAGQMPAQREEIAEALEEGIAIRNGAMLVAVRGDGVRRVLSCIEVAFRIEGSAWTATPIAGTEFSLEADAVVTAIGQDPDLDPFAATLGAERGMLRADRTQATGVAGVYAGGDAASMARFVTEAIAMGKRAAEGIHRMFDAGRVPRAEGSAASDGAASEGGASDGEASDGWTEAVVAPGAISLFHHRRQPRASREHLEVVERLTGNDEVQLGFDPHAAFAEATRCFSCGTCTHCDNCVQYCPDLAVKFDAGGYVVLTDYCKGCGLCVRECPTGSMKMVEEAR